MAIEPITREEKLMAKASGEDLPEIKPITRREMFLAKAGGQDIETPTPITREEMFLQKIAENGGGSGGDIDALIDGSLTEITSNAESVRNYGLYSNTSLRRVDFPLATTIGVESFYSNFALESVKFPSAISVGYQTFGYCSSLKIADFSSLAGFPTYGSFINCSSLKALVLRSETMAPLSSTSVFNGCYHLLGTVDSTYNPDGLKDGYIYVPRALIDSYKKATNWTTYATQFRALEDYTVDGTTTGDLDESKVSL